MTFYKATRVTPAPGGSKRIRSLVGRWVGVAAGAIGAISSIWMMPYYPIWSLTYIALGVIVIYALAAYGGPVEVTLSP